MLARGTMRADAERNRARILAAAMEAYAELGPAATTADVARRAEVAVGTVFRHFPTKPDLLVAIMKARLDVVAARARELTADPAGGLYTFLAELVASAAATRAVADLLALRADDNVAAVRSAVEPLLVNAQQAGSVRAEVRLDTVLALLAATCHEAVDAGWDDDLRDRTLAVVFAGLRPPG